MPDEILYLETLPSLTAEEVGGFSRAAVRRRGVAAAATLSSAGEFRNFSGTESCRKLVAHLRSAKFVVGYNCIAFDYELVRGEVPFRRPKTLDLMVQIATCAGRRMPFRVAAKIALGKTRLANPTLVVQAWRENDQDQVLKALRQKLRVLRRLHQHVAEHGYGQFEAVESGESNGAEDALIARRAMIERAAAGFSTSSILPQVTAMQNRGSGATRVTSGGPDCENGMIRVIGRVGFPLK